MPTGHPVHLDTDELARLYGAGLSMRQIAKQCGTTHTTVRHRLATAGVQVRDRSAANKGRNPRAGQISYGEYTCKYCGRVGRALAHEAPHRTFCSGRCSGLWRKEHGLLPAPAERPTLVCKACGRAFQPKLLYRAQRRQYCSTACMHYGIHQIRRSGHKRTVERIVEALLVGLGISYVAQWPMNSMSADFYLPEVHRCIECDGSYWHQLPSNVKADLHKERAFAAAGIAVLHLTEKEVYADICDCRERILAFIELDARYPASQPSS